MAHVREEKVTNLWVTRASILLTRPMAMAILLSKGDHEAKCPVFQTLSLVEEDTRMGAVGDTLLRPKCVCARGRFCTGHWEQGREGALRMRIFFPPHPRSLGECCPTFGLDGIVNSHINWMLKKPEYRLVTLDSIF